MRDDMPAGARALSMENHRVRVLIVAENATGFSSLSRRLEERGCRCWYAGTYSEGARLFKEHGFDVVLCADSGAGMSSIVGPLIGSTASMFRAQAVEDGCWWLPAVHHGEKCLGAPAFRPREFARVLEGIVAEVRRAAESPGALAAPH